MAKYRRSVSFGFKAIRTSMRLLIVEFAMLLSSKTTSIHLIEGKEGKFNNFSLFLEVMQIETSLEMDGL